MPISKKVIGLVIVAWVFELLKLLTSAWIIKEAVLEIYAKTVNHPWGYYAILGCIVVGLYKLQSIFRKGALEERAATAESD